MDERLRTPDWLLERFALGELPEAQAAEIRRRLEAEPGGMARLEALRASDREILERHPPREMEASILARANAAPAGSPALAADGNSPVRTGAHPRATGTVVEGAAASPRRAGALGAAWDRSKLAWGLGLAVPAAAAVLVLAVTSAPPTVAPDAPDTVRMKGLAPSLLVHRKSGAEAETLADGAQVRPHDLLQLAYVAAGRRYGVIVSFDGGGAVTLHLPSSGDAAAALDAQGATPLPQAYELDDAPAFERFVLVASDSPFEVGTVLEAARALAAAPASSNALPLSLPAGLEQTSVVVRKTR